MATMGREAGAQEAKMDSQGAARCGMRRSRRRRWVARLLAQGQQVARSKRLGGGLGLLVSAPGVGWIDDGGGGGGWGLEIGRAHV